ncbi:hypothetical protein VP01_7512g1, partial [Puccinia sorghi]
NPYINLFPARHIRCAGSQVIPNNQKWRWQDLGKLVHLVQHLKGFMCDQSARWQPKAVIFSSYVQFLEILMRSFYLKRIEKTLQHNNMMSTTLFGKLTARQCVETGEIPQLGNPWRVPEGVTGS